MGIFDRMKKKKPDFGNVKSGSSSTADAPGRGATTEARRYTVVKGDSLSKIAQRFYGDASQWRRIYEANRSEIKDPDLIHPGQTFTIPSA
jgi:nucleoid-associated protein YgaU